MPKSIANVSHSQLYILMTHNFKSTTVLLAVSEAAFCFNTTGKKIKIPENVLIRQGSRHPPTPLQPPSSCAPAIVLSTVNFRRTNVTCAF